MTRKMAIVMVIAFAVSCGGGSDSTGGGGLQQADVDQITNTIADALASASSAQPSGLTAGGAAPTNALVAERPSVGTAYTASAAVNHVMACPVAGHVTTSGNVSASCPTPPATGACTMSGMVTINYGDPTNNLNDCTYANGLVIDGSLFVSLSGTANGTAITLTETLTGSLSVNRKGPTGGLVPLGIAGQSSCFLFLTAKIPQRTITGDVCGIAVNRTF